MILSFLGAVHKMDTRESYNGGEEEGIDGCMDEFLGTLGLVTMHSGCVWDRT